MKEIILKANGSENIFDESFKIKKGTRTRGGLWPNGKVFYKNLVPKDEPIFKLVCEAIKDWNETNEHVKFIESVYSNYWVEFVFRPKEDSPSSCVGCLFNRQEIVVMNVYNQNPKSQLRKACVLHEMMHCVGFEHEHCRKDKDYHVKTFTENHNFIKKGIQIGNYDYYSLMHYCLLKKKLEFKY
eukprot:TRINITY_DN380_c0_g1_i1.p1 TRINITY_DN380_c0_g1~~TRINITY_DN380_c0_g1_i1.p1  ORF type:complete len:184 (-),score=26.08 TRINITY_DN380_c0_g1_i1:479-1030(-)